MRRAPRPFVFLRTASISLLMSVLLLRKLAAGIAFVFYHLAPRPNRCGGRANGVDFQKNNITPPPLTGEGLLTAAPQTFQPAAPRPGLAGMAKTARVSGATSAVNSARLAPYLIRIDFRDVMAQRTN